MKKTISMILCILILMSCVLSVSTSAEENGQETQNTQETYLLGDTTLDKNVSIIDSTYVQMYLTKSTDLSGLQIELSDVNETGVDINSVTSVQQYLANSITDTKIGKNVADKNEGVVYMEVIPRYDYLNGSIISSDFNAYFSTAYPDVPFMNVGEMVAYFMAYHSYSMEDIKEEHPSEYVVSYTFPTNATLTFDIENKEMIFSDYTTFLTKKDCAFFSPLAVGAPENTDLYHKSENFDKYYGGDPCSVTFDYDTIPMLKYRTDAVLLPLQTFTDFFLSYMGLFYQYNGKGIYTFNSSAPSDPDMGEYWAKYCDGKKTDTVSDAFAQVNYYEFCAILEARYGLKEAHDITDFDSYLSRKGFKKRMLSCDLKEIETAQAEVSVLLFEDFHSAINSYSPFLKDDVQISVNTSPTYQARILKFDAVKKARANTLGTPVPYERRGDTVFITFDSFTQNDISSYFKEDHQSTPEGDTIELLNYAVKRLQNEDKDAKNVVIDLSCNGGGSVTACAYVLDALIGECIICLYNPNTGALHQSYSYFDINLDGSIDKEDISIKDMGKNIAVITSSHSFSCGNLLPCTLNELDDNVLILGQQSGGGTCEVGNITTSTGAMMSISSERRLVNMKNGYISDIDHGVAPDITLSLNGMFDRDYIVEKVNEYFR